MAAGGLTRLAGRLQGLALPIPVGIGHRLQLIEQPQHPQRTEVGGDRGAGLAALHIGHREAAHAHPFGHVLQPPVAPQPGGADVAPQPLQSLLQSRRGALAIASGHPEQSAPIGQAGALFPGSLPVPPSPAQNPQTLIALGPERLAELLLELAGSDPAIKRRIRLAVANATSPQDAVALVRQRLATIARSRSFLEREQRRAVLQELTLQLEAITGPIAQAEPRAARELLWQFLELGNNVLGRCDDSSGLLGDVFRQAMGQLGRLTEAAPPDPAPLAEQVFEAPCDNG